MCNKKKKCNKKRFKINILNKIFDINEIKNNMKGKRITLINMYIY